MECKFCGSETDYFTVNDDPICEDCISKYGYTVCSRCGKATTCDIGDICSHCQNEEKDN